MVYDETGQLLTGTFLDYALPLAPDVPTFETIIVEVPSADGPYGARGIGEGPGVRRGGGRGERDRAPRPASGSGACR